MTTRGLQYIVDNASAIKIARPKTVAQMVTRSGRINTAERTSLIPYQLTVTPPAYSKLEDVKDVIEGITITDRDKNVWIQLSNNNGLDYITEYQGDLTTTQVNALRVSSTGTTATVFGTADFTTTDIFGFTTSTNLSYVRLGGLPNIGDLDKNGVAISSTSTVFRPGDYLQLRTLSSGAVRWGVLRTVPLEVLRGSGATIDVPVHRPWVNITSRGDTRGGDIYVGTEVRLRVLITRLPAYRLLPGKIVEWDGDFEMIENID